ncbi:MAG TPA: chromate efflux transporter [Tepidisphaeraceae bacterium]|nr:chromate efflux transporter [Tepidisphaeraceae bacterium]
MTPPPPSPPRPEAAAAAPSRRARLLEVAAVFARLGFTAFGGPPAHVAMIEDEVVTRRRWVDRQHFLDLVASVNFIPGPNSTELAIHLGLIRAGFAGLVVAGACFIFPAMLIILPLAYLYVRTGALPQVSAAMSGINAAVIAIVAAAVVRFARAAVTDAFTAGVAVASVAAGFWLAPRPHLQPELLILAASALLGALSAARPAPRDALLAPALLPLAVSPHWAAETTRMFLFLLKVGATLFGSGYVLVSYLQSGLVDRYHWFTRQELLDAISIGQVTPGPLLTTATFVGYVLGARTFGGGVAGGIVGGVLATAAIFLPSFLFVAALGPLLPRIRANRYARGALRAMNAAVVALIVVVLWRLGGDALFPAGRIDWPSLAIAAAALVALLVWNVNATWLIVAGAIIGVARSVQ